MKRKYVLDVLGIILGICLYSLSICVINIPNKLGEGGATGIALILKSLWAIAPSLSILLINLPLLIVSFFALGKKTILKTLFGMSILTVSLNFWTQLIPSPPQINLFLSSIATGILSGLGCGIIYRFGGSTGGTDILYLLLEKYFGIRIGTSLLCITVIILLLSLSYMNYSQFLFTLISCFIFSKTVNFVKYTQFQIPY